MLAALSTLGIKTQNDEVYALGRDEWAKKSSTAWYMSCSIMSQQKVKK